MNTDMYIVQKMALGSLKLVFPVLWVLRIKLSLQEQYVLSTTKPSF